MKVYPGPEVKVEKECKCCGNVFTTITEYVVNKLGYWWDCECGSTMLWAESSDKSENQCSHG